MLRASGPASVGGSHGAPRARARATQFRSVDSYWEPARTLAREVTREREGRRLLEEVDRKLRERESAAPDA
jgi:hypothetical protein